MPQFGASLMVVNYVPRVTNYALRVINYALRVVNYAPRDIYGTGITHDDWNMRIIICL